MPGLRPIVDGIDTVLLLNNSIAVADLFTVSDPDGDPITSYTFTDSPGASSGFFLLNGQVQANGSSFTISASELDDLRYIAAPVVSNEIIRVRASDGTQLSIEEAIKIYSARTESVRPIVQIQPTSVLGNETILVRDFVSAYDPDGYPITSYTIRDRNVDKSFFTLDGAELTQGVFHNLSKFEFNRLVYNAVGRRAENIDVYAYDGTINSLFTTEVIQTEANLNRPVVDYASIDSAQGELYALKDLIGTFDADGNSIKFYEFKDRNRKSFSGNLIFNGSELPAGEFHRFTPEQLDDVYYSPGSRNIVEEVRYRALDGRFRSAINSIDFDNSSIEQNGVLDVGVDTENAVASHLEMMPITDLFEIQDSLALDSIDIIDTNTDSRSAQLILNGEILPAGQIHRVSLTDFFGGEDDDLVGLDLLSGTYEQRSVDEIYVRANTTSVNGDWTRANFKTEPEFIRSLISGTTWSFFILPNDEGKIELTYSFMQQFPEDTNTGEAIDAPDNDPPEPFIPFTPEQREITRRTLEVIEGYANVDFIEVSDSSFDPLTFTRGGTYRFGNYTLFDSMVAGYAGLPSFAPSAGDVYINSANVNIFNFGPGTGGYATLIHEIGHTLGFSHADYNPLIDDPIQRPLLPNSTATDQFSVMTRPPTNFRPDGLSPASFALYDVFQAQFLYGVNEEHALGDDTYGIDTFAVGEFSAETVWDAGGYDTLTAAGSQRNAIVDLREGHFSSIGASFVQENIAIAFGAEIERAIGSNNDDQLYGNELGNVLIAGNGDDMLQGFGGADELRGGAGGDTYVVGLGDGNNIINEQQLAGRDRLIINTFAEFDEFSEDIAFRLDGRDLVINLAVDGGTVDTSVRIKEQTRGAYRIETLEFGVNEIDLNNLTSQATSIATKFEISSESSVFGNFVTPT